MRWKFWLDGNTLILWWLNYKLHIQFQQQIWKTVALAIWYMVLSGCNYLWYQCLCYFVILSKLCFFATPSIFFWWNPIKPDQCHFPIVALPFSSVTPQHLRLNSFNLTWSSVFVIRSLINCCVSETPNGWWHFDIAMIKLRTSSSTFSNGYGKPLPFHCGISHYK